MAPPPRSNDSSSASELSPLFGESQNGSQNEGHYGSHQQENGDAEAQADVSEKAASHAGSIGIWGSMSIAVNSLTGPAMLNLPATFQRSGFIPTTVTLVFVCLLSALCSLHMADVISKVPGNKHFRKEIEYSESFRLFWGERWFVFTQVLFFCCITCLNVSSIIDTAQVVDTFLGHHMSGGSIALQVFSDSVNFVRWDANECLPEEKLEGDCIPFKTSRGLLLTAGYLVSAMMLFPLALMDLKENASFQVVAFMVLLINSLQFVVQFLMSGIDVNNLTMWGESWEALFGVVLFNFSLVIAIPAWLYEKKPSISAPTVVHGSSLLSTLLYIVVGTTGALAIPKVSDNMLESMMSGAFGPTMALGASIFAFFIVGLGCPLFSVLTRMNLTGSGLCSHAVGNCLAVYLPWSVSWMFYQGVTEVLAWGGVLFLSFIAFILPLLLALHTVLEYDDKGSVSVYNGWITTKHSESIVLYVLLSLAVISVILAILGQFLSSNS